MRAKTNIELVTQVTGKVTFVSDAFVEGGQFDAGETLLRIDDADYLVALKAAEASVASAEVELETERAAAVTSAKEWQDLQKKPLDQANPLRLNKPQVRRALANLDAAKAELAAAKLNYDRTRISAPFAGRIETKAAELGQFMARGDSVGRVFATDIMEVRIPMTDIQIDELGLTLGYSSSSLRDAPVKFNQNVIKQSSKQSALAATVSAVFGIDRHTWQGYLKSVDASIDNQTRLVFATIVVDNPFASSDERPLPLAPGLFVDVALESPQKIKGIEIPRTALRNGNQVYLYEDEKLYLRPVKVIYTSEDVVMVSEASQTASRKTTLLNDDLVITSSVPGAYDGMPVKLLNASPSNQVAEPGLEEGLDEAKSQPEPSQADSAQEARLES